MRALTPNRFTNIKILRETRAIKTFIASDQYLDKEPTVLVKYFRRRYFDVNRPEAERVISVFTGLRHQNLSRMLDVGLTGDGDLYVVREHFSEVGSPAPPTFDAITKLISTVLFLHSNKQVHGAIKPSNVFVSDTTFKVSDPRMWKLKTDTESEEEIRFTAPEILNGAAPTYESDLYSVGALLYRWVVGQDPFDDSAINQLKLKYLWASPQPITGSSNVLHHVSDAVLDLLQKDPKKRPPAFDVIVNALKINATAAVRAAFVGRNEIVQRVRKTILNENKSLSAIVIEGPAGIGKSRLIEQLRINCLFDSVDFGVCNCTDESSALEPITSAILDLLRWRQSKRAVPVELIMAAAGKPLGAFNVSEHESTISILPYPIERSISDMVGSIGILARSSKLAVVIEDVDRSSPTMLKFIEQLCFRAAELPLTLVITGRDRLWESPVGTLLRRVLGTQIEQLRLKPLVDEDMLALSRFLGSEVLNSEAAKQAGGNPLFLEHYLQTSPPFVPPVVQASVEQAVTNLTTEETALVEVLCLFDRPVEGKVLSQICDESVDQVLATFRRKNRC